jgi:uncharacterized tellurite resistance protein B-like protein
MTPLKNLHYAIGELAYAVANADGKVQNQERLRFHDIVAAELRIKHFDFDISEIIFRIMDKDKTDVKTAYNQAMKDIRLNSHYLSPELKQKFIRVMEKVAKAFKAVSEEERSLIDKFKCDIQHVYGDPVFYSTI